jgi:DNA invertase Pin-like site-specific DNA recombinase
MAEFERELMSERTSAGMKAAKRRGRHVGRPPKLTLDQLALARRLIDSDQQTRAGAAALLKVGKSTLRRALNAPDGSGGTVGKTSGLCTGWKTGLMPCLLSPIRIMC